MIDLSGLAGGNLTPELYQEFRRMCRALVYRRGYPVTYSPTGQWDDEAYDDLVDQWFATEKQKIAVFAGQPEWFWYRAEKSLERFILNHRQRTVGVVLYRQVISILRSSPCFRQKESGLWGLSSWSGSEPAYDGCEPILLRAAYAVSRDHPLTKEGRIRSAWVKESLESILRESGMWVRAGDLTGALLKAIGVTQSVLISEFSSGDIEVGGLGEQQGEDSETEALVLLAAQEVVENMTSRQRATLRALVKADEMSAAAVARVLGVSQPTADKWIRGVLAVIRAHSPEPGLCDLVLKKAEELVMPFDRLS